MDHKVNCLDLWYLSVTMCIFVKVKPSPVLVLACRGLGLVNRYVGEVSVVMETEGCFGS